MADQSDFEKRAAVFAEAVGLPEELGGVQELVRQGIKQRAATLAEFAALPEELKKVREAARRAITPLKPSDANTEADGNFLFTARRTEASRHLPPYYLVYFLLVYLLDFRNLGRF